MTNSYKKVLLTGDILRFRQGTSAFDENRDCFACKNIQWFYKLLSGLLGEVSSLPVGIINWSSLSGGQRHVDVPALFSILGQTPDFYGWVHTYNKKQITDEEINWVHRYFSDAFIVGFELSPYQQALFDAAGLTYVSMSIAPARFAQDLLVTLETNNQNALGKNSFLRWYFSDLRQVADLLSAKYIRYPSLKIQPKSALFCGQVNDDASLIDGKRMVTLQEFLPDIFTLAEEHSELLVKCHPHGRLDPVVVEALDRLPNVRYINGDIYQILAHDNLKTVSAISSSVLFESQFFGKQTRRFLKNDFDFGDGADKYFFDKKILTPSFWEPFFNRSNYTLRTGVDMGSSPIATALHVNWKIKPNPNYDPAAVALIPYNEEIPLNCDGPVAHLLPGAESWGTWSTQQCLILPVRVSANITSDLLVYLHLKRLKVRAGSDIFVGINGKAVDVIKLQEGDQILKIDVPRSLIGSLNILRISLETTGFSIPAIEFGTEDYRKLYLGVVSMRVVPKDGRCPISERGAQLTLLDGQVKSASQDNVFLLGQEQIKFPLRFRQRPNTDIILRVCPANSDHPLSRQQMVICCVNGKTRLLKRLEDAVFPIPRSSINVAGELDITLALSRATLWGSEADGEVSPVEVRAIELFPMTLQAPAVKTKSLLKVGVIGQMRVSTGMGIAARNIERALKLGLGNERVSSYNIDTSVNAETEPFQESNLSSEVAPITISLLPPHVMNHVAHNGHEVLFRNTYRICHGAWELPLLPSIYADSSQVDEYWGMTNFVTEAARKAGMPNCRTVPIPVSIPNAKKHSRVYFDLDEKRFLFLFTFNVDSTLARKNPMGVVRAFQKAFPNSDEPVGLVLKCKVKVASQEIRHAFEELKKYVLEDERITIIDKEMPFPDVIALYSATDAYISLHRSEGFGLTLAEAMALNRPVIGTAYSGNLDFMTAENSELVTAKITETGTELYHNQRQSWAEPDIASAARAMVRLYNDPIHAARIARLGRQTIFEHFSIEAVSRILVEQVKRIEAII